jgi:hypothetical protein
MRHRSAVRRFAIVGAVVILAGCVYAVGVFLSVRGVIYAGALASVAALVVALVTLVAPLLARWWSGPPFLTSMTVAEATESLAMMVERQLSQDERERSINDPWPMPVRWEASKQAHTAVAGFLPEHAGDIAPDSGADLSGHLRDIPRVFLNIPSRRFVVLGPAGAGKSVLAARLARDLLASRSPMEAFPFKAVPVILPAVNWDPAENLFSWVAAWLSRNYPNLSLQRKGATGEATTIAQTLVESGRVMPIIDGLDELPEYARVKALVQINAAGSDIPIVLTSRPREYSRAVALSGRHVTQALAIELLPLRPAEVQAYLVKATSEIPAGRWEAVFARLAADPRGPLTTTLTNPLMLWLCRTIYASQERNPDELADPVRFPDQEAIEDHLLDELVPALYPGMGRAYRRWTEARAGRWLAFLAEYLDKAREPYLSWWRLDRAVPAAWRALGAAIRGALLAAAAWGLAVWILWRGHEWVDGRYVRHVALSAFLFNGPAGSLLRSSADHLVAGTNMSSDFTAYARWLLALLSPHSLLLFALKVGMLQFVLAAVFGSAAIRSRNVLPKTLAHKMNIGQLVRAILLGVGGTGLLIVLLGPSAHLALLFLAVLGASLASTVASAFAWPLGISAGKSPLDILRADRKTTLILYPLMVLDNTAFIWLFFGTSIALVVAAFGIICLLYSTLFGEMNSYAAASLIFTEARIELAFSRRMPMRMMTFLADAHRRGVLRRAGALYEFRHIRLQQRLARQHISLLVFAAAIVREAFDIWDSHLASVSEAADRWLPSSAAPVYWRVWARRFREACAGLPPELKVGAPVDGMYRAGPGLAQRYRSADSNGYWTLCALPSRRPVLVAGVVWDGIKDIGSKMTRDDSLAAFGLPVLDNRIPAAERVIGPDATDVLLAEGSWGTGNLVRDDVGADWRWSVESGLGGWSLGRVPWNPANIGQRPLRIVAATSIPRHSRQPLLSRQASAGLDAGLQNRALFQTAVALLANLGVDLAGDWRNTKRKSSPGSTASRFEIGSRRHRRAVIAEVSLSLRNNERDRFRRTRPEIRAEVRLDIYGVWQAAVEQGKDERQRQKFLDHLVALFVASWETSANILLSTADDTLSASVTQTRVELKLAVPQRFDAATQHESAMNQLMSALGSDEYNATAWIGGPIEMTREERQIYAREGIAEMGHWLRISTPGEWKHQNLKPVHSPVEASVSLDDIKPDNGGYAHFIPKIYTAHAVADQQPVRALCGWTWIPQESRLTGDDLSTFPTCPACNQIYEDLPEA